MTTQQDNPDNEVICYCSGTKRGQIRELFLQGKDVEAISRWTGALTGCGGCEWDIQEFLEELAIEQSKQST
ncbi:(2Fe-2S)-binding protein [Methylovorus sp. MM2]|uniref:(2Fe-2S)-binding protein n=1 Tax=Methylovorus sp. MM2 TaxID=1848038 RepID=UPI0007E24DBE|nr:(2Fe-2S)-binding protein [Methylovorus sp. MM2]OAM51642.1 (2Fe-2S)-binding protein [Methylovorus sp. MM2]